MATVFDLTGSVSGLEDMQAMRNCYVTRNGAGNYDFRSWVEDSQWVKLDQDAQILLQNNGGTGTSLTFPNNGGNTPNMSSLQNIGSVQDAHTASLPGVVYSTYGNITAPNSNFYFGVAEATLANGNYIFKNPDPDGRPTNVMAVKANRFTGRTQIATISESGEIE